MLHITISYSCHCYGDIVNCFKKPTKTHQLIVFINVFLLKCHNKERQNKNYDTEYNKRGFKAILFKVAFCCVKNTKVILVAYIKTKHSFDS